MSVTAGLARLLGPNGQPSLGDRVLRGLIGWLGLPPVVSCPVSVAVEVTLGAGQARVQPAVRVSGSNLLSEAEVSTDERPCECDRLAEAWGS